MTIIPIDDMGDGLLIPVEWAHSYFSGVNLMRVHADIEREALSTEFDVYDEPYEPLRDYLDDLDNTIIELFGPLLHSTDNLRCIIRPRFSEEDRTFEEAADVPVTLVPVLKITPLQNELGEITTSTMLEASGLDPVLITTIWDMPWQPSAAILAEIERIRGEGYSDA